MAVAIQSEREVMRMHVFPKFTERRGLLSAYETIQTILGFGMFTIALIALIVKLLKMTRKITVYFDQARLFLNNKIGHRLKRFTSERYVGSISLFFIIIAQQP